mgnify:CR=1 FL=1
MRALRDNLDEASDCIKAMDSRIERLRQLIGTRRRQGQSTAWAETLLEIMLSSRHEAVVRRDVVLLQMRLRLLGDASSQCRKLVDQRAYAQGSAA